MEKAVSKEVLEEICKISVQRERFKNAFFWEKDNGNKNTRNWKTRRNTVGPVSWIEGGKEYSAYFTVDYSRKNTYVRTIYSRDGKETNWTAIKNSFNRMLKTVKDDPDFEGFKYL